MGRAPGALRARAGALRSYVNFTSPIETPAARAGVSRSGCRPGRRSPRSGRGNRASPLSLGHVRVPPAAASYGLIDRRQADAEAMSEIALALSRSEGASNLTDLLRRELAATPRFRRTPLVCRLRLHGHRHAHRDVNCSPGPTQTRCSWGYPDSGPRSIARPEPNRRRGAPRRSVSRASSLRVVASAGTAGDCRSSQRRHARIDRFRSIRRSARSRRRCARQLERKGRCVGREAMTSS